ncbi:regulator of RNase E activity RraA [Rhodoligotrophos appendicifer]|uniref:RraA family protein n=1 Tax=Rhodoligotrophos appendicifer TaxID=987056 RepID=UPI00118526CE|nr:RraA family protein [Rhodoligotrophos appendicifer]
MALQKHDADFRILSAAELDAWRAIPPAVASDCMNRTQVMIARIKPISTGMTLCGQARTAVVMVGDCGPICVQIEQARPGEIVVVDAGGVEDVAVWGGMMAEAAVYRRIGGAVVDGAVRDVADMRKAGLRMFCRAFVPRGPHHGFGGVVDGSVSVGGVPISSGDIILGDDDGVVVVPLADADRILKAAQQHVVKEKDWIDGLRRGEPLPDVYGTSH